MKTLLKSSSNFGISRIAFAWFLLASSEAFSLADAEIAIGRKYSTFTSHSTEDSLSVSQLYGAAHIDPIPLVPVAFGAFYLIDEGHADQGRAVISYDDWKGTQWGVEVKGWSPISFMNLTPYGKYSYTLWGDYRGTGLVGGAIGRVDEYRPFGSRVSVGLMWNPIALVSGILEVAWNREQFKLTKQTLNGVDHEASDYPLIDAAGWSVLIGFNVGI